MNMLYRALSALLVACVTTVRAADPIITEIMPQNARILAGEDGDFPDWIEIKNPGPGDLNLAGYFLTDDPARPTKWMFPAVPLPAGAYLTIFASGQNRTTDPAHLHTSFALAGEGGYLAIIGRLDIGALVAVITAYVAGTLGDPQRYARTTQATILTGRCLFVERSL